MQIGKPKSHPEFTKKPKLNNNQLRQYVFTIVLGFFLIYSPLPGQIKLSKPKYTKKTYIYKIVDNHKIRADVYRGYSEGAQPAIIWIHGGALIFGARSWINSELLEKFIDAGYTVVSIDYRLAPETKLASIISDLEDAYYWVKNKGPELISIDPARIAVGGESAGGYLTLLSGFRVTPPPKALVSFFGYGEITGPWYSAPDPFYNQRPKISRKQAHEYVGNTIISNTPEDIARGRAKFYHYCRQNGLWPQKISGHDPEREKEWYRGYESIRNVTSKYPPTILLHGESDTDVPFEQSRLMAKELESHNVDFEFVTHPDWGHSFDKAGLKDPTVKAAFNKVILFLEKHLK